MDSKKSIRKNYSQELFYFLDAGSTVTPEKTGAFLTELQQKWINIRYAYPNQFRDFFLYSSNPGMETLNSWKWYIRTFSDAQESFDMTSGNLQESASGGFFYASPQMSPPTAEHAGFTVMESRSLILPVWFPVRDFRTQQAVGALRLDIPLEKLSGIRTLLTGYVRGQG